MQPRIEILPERKLVGRRMTMTLSDDKTGELWRSFMPRSKEIKHTIGSELYSLRIYDSSYFKNLNPDTKFDSWAAVEVTDFESIPIGMEPFVLPDGLYAVFLDRGPASSGPETFRYIFDVWLPASGYEPDDRPHVAVMGEKYKNEDPDSEEELCIPIRPKI